MATQYFADRDVFCAGRVAEEDLRRTMKACGGSIQTSIQSLLDDVLGTCEDFEEVQIGGERYIRNLSTCSYVVKFYKTHAICSRCMLTL